nr:glycosyltransferase family 2 protein [Chloroflexota bacterium]
MPADKHNAALMPTHGEKAHPLVSVIIVNYNGRHYLEACLRSLLSNNLPPHEIILVDNASTDDSVSYAQRAFPSVRVICNQANLGFGPGCNAAARYARGQYLAFLNPDTVVKPGWLEALIAALQADPQAGLATPKILLLADPERINTCGNEVHYTGLTLCRGFGMMYDAFPHLEEVSAVSGAAFAIRRDLFAALGGFDEAFFLYMEDTDLSWRACLAGYRCLYVPSSIVLHDYTLRFGPLKTFYQERNRYLMLLKGLRWATLLILLPALLLAEGVTWAFTLLRDHLHWRNKVRAYRWIAAHWQEVMRKRRQVQAQRKVPDRDLLRYCAYRLPYEQLDTSLVGRLAGLVLNPLFFILHKLALALIRW